MPYLLGTDEAGYGPNLGPLIISATVWRIPDDALGRDLYDVLLDVVSRKPQQGDGHRRLVIADSKAVYKPRGSLSGLEYGVLTALAMTGRRPESWQAVWDALDPECREDRDPLPWYRDYDREVPIDADKGQLQTWTQRLKDGLGRTGIELVSMRSTAVFPGRFNRRVDECGNKSTLLSTATLELLRREMARLPNEPIVVVCDKHGGRNKYGPLLQQAFPDYLVEIRRETREESLYCWGPSQRRVEIRFRVGGERFLPAALASMASKYLRELAMRALNQYWCSRVKGLAPTAGYPVDAKRFKAQIEPVQHELGIDDRLLWRSR